MLLSGGVFENYIINLQLMFSQENKKPEEHKEEDSGDEADEDIEKEVVGNWKLVDLPEMPKVTGEEEEEELAKFRSKIYRFRKEWKERGVGELRFLKHKTSGYVRILVRAEKTHKCLMNHFIISKDIFCQLEQLKTSNNSWTWAAYDISDEKAESEKFCAKFTSKEDFEKFEVEFKRANDLNKAVSSAKQEKVAEKVEEKVAEKVEEKAEKVEDKKE